MSNKIRGDYQLDDLALELIGKLTHLRAEHLSLPAFDAEMRALMDTDFNELWRRVADASGVIFLGDSKEAVDLFNVIFELYDTIDGDEDAALSEELANKVVAVATQEDKHAEARISVLANLYNAAFLTGYPAFRDLRFSVLRALVAFAAKQKKKLGAVEAFLANTKPLFKALDTAPVAVQRSTLSAIYEALRASGEATQLEQTYLIKYLATFNAESEHAAIDAGVLSLACTAIATSIRDVLAANGRQLLSLAAVKALATSGDGSKAQLFQLLGIFNDGLLPDYLAFQAERGSVLKEFGIDHEQAVRSMRLLSLCSACNNADKNGEITYAKAAEQMGLEAADEQGLAGKVEEWIMLAIKNGLVDVKMCQQSQKIIVFSSTQRNFQPEQWQEMAKKLGRWKTQVSKLLVTVKNLRLTQQGRAQGLR